MELTLENGDCLELMKKLPDKSVDLFICDLPYAETNCKWDIAIDMVQFWAEFKRLRKSPKTACIHFCSTKFGYQLIKSWEKGFKMDMVWKKRNKTGGLQSRHRPMRNHEMVYFFYDQAPKYNRDKYHKRIEAKPAIEKSETAVMGKEPVCKSNFEKVKYFEPPNPASVFEADGTELYGHKDNKSANGWDKSASAFYNKDKKIEPSFYPKLPASVLESDANKAEVYKDRKKGNKDGWGMDEDFKNVPFKHMFDPPNPASVLEEKEKPKKNKKKTIPLKDRKAMGEQSGIYPKENQISTTFDPPNPASVLEETPKKKRDEAYSTRAKEGKDIFGNNDTRDKPFNFDPPNPASVLEEKPSRKSIKDRTGLNTKSDLYPKENQTVSSFEPINPSSVLEEKFCKEYYETNKTGMSKTDIYSKEAIKEFHKENGIGFDPPNPASVVEEQDDIYGETKEQMRERNKKHTIFAPPNPSSVVEEYVEPAEDEPWSMFESTKVFIGKRNHQTEKPLDILEFFLKYWTNDNDTILDPTMGSGSTGVACKNIGNRKFIGYEMNETIFKVAQKRCGVESL